MLALAAVTVATRPGTGQPAPLAPPPSTRPPVSTRAPGTTSPPDVSMLPDPGEVQTPAGSPPGKVGEQMVHDVATELARCAGGDEPKVLVAWGTAHRRTWLILAKPPRPGENGLCWGNGLFNAGGAGGMGYEVASTNPPQPLRASGSQNIQADGRFWGHIIGVVPKQAARVRVEFREGIAPLELEPIRTDDRFPINFFAGFYPQPGEDLNSQWWATKVIAYDQAGRTIAECQTTGGPGPSC